jgi:hypothetical protein
MRADVLERYAKPAGYLVKRRVQQPTAKARAAFVRSYFAAKSGERFWPEYMIDDEVESCLANCMAQIAETGTIAADSGQTVETIYHHLGWQDNPTYDGDFAATYEECRSVGTLTDDDTRGGTEEYARVNQERWAAFEKWDQPEPMF